VGDAADLPKCLHVAFQKKLHRAKSGVNWTLNPVPPG
jgi:hypothetical protein